MKKIAIFSDIHGNYQALKSILEDISKDDYDYVICLGDVVGIGPNSKECLDALIDSNVIMILGNHERYVLNDKSRKRLSSDLVEHEKWVESLLSEKEFSYLRNCLLRKDLLIEGKIFSFSHFLIEDENSDYPFYSLDILKDDSVKEIIKNYEADYIFCGHYHDDFEIFGLNKYFQIIKSSGVNISNICSYLTLEIKDNLTIVKRKDITYDRENFEKSIKDASFTFLCNLFN